METPSRSAVIERIKLLLAADLEIGEDSVAAGDETTPLLGRGIGLDSIEAMALALALEREFDIEIPDAELTVDLFASLGTLADLVQRKVAGRSMPEGDAAP